jgi:LacI family transcriptional regulator
MPARQYRIALLISTVGASERNVLRGIGEFARGARDWVCQFQQPSPESIQRVAAYEPDGVIAAVWSESWIEPLKSLKIPVVNVADVLEDLPFPSVNYDSVAIGRLAAQYFVDRGFDRLGYLGLRGPRFSRTRGEAFRAEVARLGRTCEMFELTNALVDVSYGWREQDRDLADWLKRIEPPAAILTSNDGRALQLIEAAKLIGYRIPDDLAVLGVDNDELHCNLSRPPLSSIQLASEKLGYEAARLLDAMLSGRPRPKIAPLAPMHVVTRQSSDVLAINDRDLACAIKYIRDHAHRPIRADEVARQVAIARRSLERRFVAQLGHTILDEIHTAHTDLAKQLLSNTDLGMPDVAEKSGFASTRHLPLIFKRLTGMTPSQYRAKHRLRE